MDRTSAANYADIGGGRRGFRNRNLLTSVRGTTHDAKDRNAVQEEIMAVIEAAGLVPNALNWAQMLQACRLLFGGGGTLASSGCQYLADRLLMQWSVILVPAATAVTWHYPQVFASAVFSVQALQSGSIGNAETLFVNGDETYLNSAEFDNVPGATSVNALVMAIGR